MPKNPNQAIIDGGLPTGISQAIKTVGTAGTQVALGASTSIKSIVIKAEGDNTGTIFVGNSTVSSADGYPLSAGDSVSFDVDDLATVFIDTSVNGDGVNYLALLF